MEVESMRPCEMKVQVPGELDSLMSTRHKRKTFERKEPQLRQCPHKNQAVAEPVRRFLN